MVTVRRFLVVLGALSLVVIVAATAGVGILAYRGNALDAESKAFVDGTVPAITASWSKQLLLDRATPELRQSVKPEQLTALFETVSRLGPLLEYEGATGQSYMGYNVGSGGIVSAIYIAKARFQNGDATFRLVLMKRDGNWMIHNFRVDPTPGVHAAQRT
jgi:hypothetical protein